MISIDWKTAALGVLMTMLFATTTVHAQTAATIQDESSRWTLPFVGGVRVHF